VEPWKRYAQLRAMRNSLNNEHDAVTATRGSVVIGLVSGLVGPLGGLVPGTVVISYSFGYF
jgi:hypothetical protein